MSDSNHPKCAHPIDDVQTRYDMSDDEMMELFGTDIETQNAMLRRRPELRSAVGELDSLMTNWLKRND